jgi:outer membrane protein assembly factor BamB
MGQLANVNPPAVINGKVYVASTGHEDTYFWTFDATTGRQLARERFNSQWATYLAPTVYAGKVYTQSGYTGGITRYDATTSAFEWFSNSAGFGIQTTYVTSTSAAVDDQSVYMCGDDSLYILDPATGKVRSSIRGGSGGHVVCTPVLDGQGAVFQSRRSTETSGSLERHDVAKGSLSWLLNGQFQSAPVVVNGVVYINNGYKFEARSALSGELQWSWEAPSRTTSDLVIVGNHAFVGTTKGLHAVDLRSRQSVWSYPVSGTLAVSANGVLYIAHPDGLTAINLH